MLIIINCIKFWKMNGEIITLQFGNYSNFVGTHFFNLQDPNEIPINEEYDHNVLWKETGRRNAKTYTPRLLAFDLKENLISSRCPELVVQNENENAQLWDGKIEIFQPNAEVTPAATSSSKPWRFDDGRDGWTDLAKWKVSPEVIHMIPNLSNNPEKNCISSFSQGLEIRAQMDEEISDGIRKYAEECDHLHGFVVLVDQEDGISGLAGGMMQNLSDDYDKKCCFAFGLSPLTISQSGEKDTAFKNRIANVALLWNRFNQHSSVFSSISLSRNIFSVDLVPRIMPFASYKAESVYESSSILGATLHALLSPVTTTSSMCSLPEMSSFLGAYGRKMPSIGSIFPFPCDIRRQSLYKSLQDKGFEAHQSLTPCVDLDLSKASGNYFVLKGLSDKFTITEEERRKLESWKHGLIKNTESCVTIFAQESFPRSINIVKSITTSTTLEYPFPNIIPSLVLEKYFVDKRYTRGVLDVWDVPIMASAHNTPQVGGLLDALVNEIGGGIARKVHAYFSTSNIDMELDDFVQCVEDLNTLSENYNVRLE